MLQSEYEALCSTLNCRDDVLHAAIDFKGKYSYDTILAIFDQFYMRQMWKSSYLAKEHGHEFLERYDRGHSLLDIAEWINLTPCMVARRFLELRLKSSRQAIARMLRDPEKFISESRIKKEVSACVQNDNLAGPFMDRQRAVLGQEYEFMLLEKLRNIGLQFETETDLRARGTHKTPDILLRVPVAFDGNIVRWIDSKGKYGDEFFMLKDYDDAVGSYINRFGPGMVIYWLGFIQDCKVPMLDDAGVYVVDKFPTDIQVLKGTLQRT